VSELFGRSEPRVGDLSKHDAEMLERSLGPLLERANGVSWYDEPGADVDIAMAKLCLLRRARASVAASIEAGDDAVRLVLMEADKDVLVWMLSRSVSYMDEQGFPDIVPGVRHEDQEGLTR
jgi:hypothetical protein